MADTEAQAGAAGHDRRRPELHPDRPFRGPIPDSSVSSTRRVTRFDGRTRIIAGRAPGGVWYRLRHRTPLTREHAQQLREAGVAEVVLRRGLRSASFSLAWLSGR